MASVIGDEYPGWLTRTAVYGLATGVSFSRIFAEQHFPSDVLVGSATGWLIGHYVYRAHHNFTLNPFDTTPMPGDMGAPRIHPVPASRLPIPPDPIDNRPPQPLSADVDPDTIGSTNVPHGQLDLPGTGEDWRPWASSPTKTPQSAPGPDKSA